MPTGRGGRRSISMKVRDRVGALSSLELTKVPGSGEPLKSFFLESIGALSATVLRIGFQEHRGQILPLGNMGNRNTHTHTHSLLQEAESSEMKYLNQNYLFLPIECWLSG